MAGRNAPQAVKNFVDPLHKVIDCITNAQLDVRGGYQPTPPDKPHLLTLADGKPQRLSGTDLSLSMKQLYCVYEVEDDSDKGPWKVSTTEYNYTFRDSDGKAVMAYHWHPAERFKVRCPHLHLYKGARVGRSDLHKVHIPTNRILLEDVVWFAISELGATPRRDDWEQVLEMGRAVFKEDHYWGLPWEGVMP